MLKIIMKHSGSDPNNISTDVINVLKATYKENLSINLKFGTNNYLMNLSEEGQSYLFEISQIGRQLEDSQEYREIKNSDVPDEIKKLIKGMLDPDYTKRLTAAEAFQTLEEYMSQKYPKVLEKVDPPVNK